MASARRIQAASFHPLRVHGKVPFFYYLLHFTSVHFAALLTTAALGLNWRWWESIPPKGSFLLGLPPGFGFRLPMVYLIWFLIVALCYLPCKWYAGVKQGSQSRWLSYL
ncbi:MAG: hypothetical protein NVS9B15_16840 [Acidobacteriaceae bacterium]